MIELETLQQHPGQGGVTMPSLIKFRAQSLDGNDSGCDTYNRCSEAVIQLGEQRGGSVIWVGPVDHPTLYEGGDVDWSITQPVFSPNRATFIDTVTCTDYMKTKLDRFNRAENHAIPATITRLANECPQDVIGHSSVNLRSLSESTDA